MIFWAYFFKINDIGGFMESIRTIFKVGYGPSSSHTMGPAYAATKFLQKNINADRFKVDLYGSLALTGKGHLTDVTLLHILGESRTEVVFHGEMVYSYHPNGMKFYAYKNDVLVDEWLVFSVGGGMLKELDEPRNQFHHEVYPHKNMGEILKYINKNNMTLIDYIKTFEDDEFFDYLEYIFNSMEECIKRGLASKEIIPGPLNLKRKSYEMYQKYLTQNTHLSLLFALTLAVSEENASGGVVVTTPTCGASGVVPGVLFTEYYYNHINKEKLIEALAIAGLICNIVKTNASISGAEVGCQGKVGVACSAAAGMLAHIKGGNCFFVEYAAEIALEHHLGMTCDPVDGLVQIPCIERNAMAAEFAYSAANYALMTDGSHYVKLDSVIDVMHETGKDIHSKYRETSTGGLALRVKKK